MTVYYRSRLTYGYPVCVNIFVIYEQKISQLTIIITQMSCYLPFVDKKRS